MLVKTADPEDYAGIYDIIDKAFRQPRIERTMIDITMREDPGFRRGDLRIVEVDGKIVSMMMIIRRPLRIGSAIVNGAIVGPVATLPDYERRGYCSAVMRDAIRYMKAEGFDMTILWGHPWLYPHYGYSPAMLNTELVIKPRQDSSLEKDRCEFRPFEEADLEQITRIYNSNTATRTCAEVRSPKLWEWKPRGSAKLEVLADCKGEVVGYYCLGTDWGHPAALEVGALNDEVCEAIFNRLLETVVEKSLTELRCLVHPDHPFAHFAFWRGGEIRIRSGGGAGMARVLNLVSLLTKMEEEFERRLRYSELHDLNATLRISSEEESAILSIDHGQVSVSTEGIDVDHQLTIPLLCLNPLITGYKGIRELVKDPHIKVGGGERALRLIEVLFPTGYPGGGVLPLVWE